LVASPTDADDLDLQLAALGETSPSITVTAAAVVTTYINTTTYGVIDNSDDWTTDSTISIIALILAVLGWVAFVYVWCNQPKAVAGGAVLQKAAAPAPAAAAAPGTTFVAANVA
jgi:hypothetical protein